METPNNFCPFRFLRCVQIFIFIQIANLYRSSRNYVSTFPFPSKRKSRHPYLSKFSQVCTQIYTHLRKCVSYAGCLDLRFEENENVNTFKKIWTTRFAIWMKMKIWTPFRNLNGQKLLGVSTSRCLKKVPW